MSEDVPFSPSAKQALQIAQTRAVRRNSQEVSGLDVLVGVFRSHPDSSEPLQLLRHVEIDPRQFSESCERADNGFGAIGNLRPGTLGSQQSVNAPNMQRPPSKGGFQSGAFQSKTFQSEAPLAETPASASIRSELLETPEEEQYRSDAPSGAVDSAEVNEIIEHAKQLGIQFTPDDRRQVRLADLFGGVLLTDNAGARLLERALAATFLPLDDVRKSYPDYLPWVDTQPSYADYLAAHHPPPSFQYSGFAADTTGEEDLIGIGPEVHAMAYLIAAKSLVPPLAIGLFGDWGSGKSYFMDALRKRINKITRDARESGRSQGQIDIYKYVVQIEFNAWHYVEGELWASLVEHILRNLQHGSDAESELQRRKKHWIEKIHETRLKAEELEELKTQLQTQVDEKTKNIETAERSAAENQRKLAQLTAADVWDVVTLDGPERAEVAKVIETAGLGAANKPTAELVKTFDESLDLLRRGGAVLAPLRASGWRAAVWVLAVLGVAFAGPLLSFALQRFQLPFLSDAIVTLGGSLSAASAALGVANGWLRRWLEKAEVAKATLDKKRKEGEATFLERVAALRTEAAKLQEDLELARREGERKRQELRELEQELDGLTPGRVLLDFISERVGSEDYRKHLGIAALIRRDFGKLSSLIQESNADFNANDTGKVLASDRDRINRIVLYIDDLDRCPPDKVVSVLQAVHLLMAFPLFVVIVAVDSRWLAQSLRSHYDKLLVDADRPDANDGPRQATADDYLEKIFQIPFWIRPLEENARMRIVQGLVEKSLVVRKRDGVDPRRAKDVDGKESDGGSGNAREVVKWDSAEPQQQMKASAPTDLKPRSLQIEQEELDWMEALRPILGQSPRAVKRFVNVYRLIKASAAPRGSKFVSDAQDADYKIVLFLLAVVTGLPALSETFFRTLLFGNEDTTLTSLAGALPQELGEEPLIASRPAAIAVETARLNQWLRRDEIATWGSVTVSRLSEWVRRVARFSYRIELTDSVRER